MSGSAAVGVYHDLSSGEAAVSHGTADDEASGGIDEVFGVFRHQLPGQDFVEDVLFHILMNLLLGHFGAVLGGENHRIQLHGLSVLIVLYRHLGLAVGTKVGQGAVLADFRQFSGEAVGQRDGIGHQLRCLIYGVAEHHALVAGADGLQLFIAHLLLSGFQRPVYAHGDIRGLLMNHGLHRAGIRVKSHVGPGVADGPHGITDNLLNVHMGLGGNLSHDGHNACGGYGLAGGPGHGILGQHGVQDGIGDLVAHFIRMSFCYGFGGK